MSLTIIGNFYVYNTYCILPPSHLPQTSLEFGYVVEGDLEYLLILLPPSPLSSAVRDITPDLCKVEDWNQNFMHATKSTLYTQPKTLHYSTLFVCVFVPWVGGVRGQLLGIASLFPLCGSPELESSGLETTRRRSRHLRLFELRYSFYNWSWSVISDLRGASRRIMSGTSYFATY